MSSNIDTLVDPRRFVAKWFLSNNYTATQAIRSSIMFPKLCLDYAEIFRQERFANPNLKIGPLREKALEHAYSEFIMESVEAEKKRILKDLACTAQDTSHLAQWVASVTGKESPLDVAVMAHWLWMIKRKSLELPIKYPIMPIIYGRQQGGKSTAVVKLIKPIQELRMNMKLPQLSDERTFFGLSTNLVAFFDEMQGAKTVDMNALKNQITTDSNTYRKLYTTFMSNVPMSCSFIGTTNKHINEMLLDGTGMRRFYEVLALRLLNWKLLEQIDYVALWRGIDENLEDGYLVGDLLLRLNEVQQGLVNEEDIDTYIRERMLVPEDGVREITATQLYRDYLQFVADNGVKYPYSRNTFVKRAENRGIKSRKVKETLVFEIAFESTVKGEASGTLLPMSLRPK